MSDEGPDGASEVPAEPLDAAAMPKALQGDILAGYMADGVAFTESIRRAYVAGVAAGRAQPPPPILAAIDNALRNGSYMTGANLAFEMLCDQLGVDRDALEFRPDWAARISEESDHG